METGDVTVTSQLEADWLVSGEETAQTRGHRATVWAAKVKVQDEDSRDH